MSVWDTYPAHYRISEITQIKKAVQAGDCVCLVGLSGAGKSNLMGVLSHHKFDHITPFSLDCNHLSVNDPSSLLTAINELLGKPQDRRPSLQSISSTLEDKLKESAKGVCLLLDRFDLFQQDATVEKQIASFLRSLRDRFKYDLTYVIATRRPLDPASELAELFFASTLWLGSLTNEDAVWSVSQFAKRHQLHWNTEEVQQILNFSTGYPSMMRGVCEAYAAGTPLVLDAIRQSAPVVQRVEEFWKDNPTKEILAHCGLINHPLLSAGRNLISATGELTAAEQRLMDYLAAFPGKICTKEELIAAVWPDEKQAAGLRDDSLTQLVHRLREKIDPGGLNKIQTLPGRGYRFNP